MTLCSLFSSPASINGIFQLSLETELSRHIPAFSFPKTCHLKHHRGTFLVVQWLRIHLPMQGTQVQALVREDPTCRGAAKPVRHNY